MNKRKTKTKMDRLAEFQRATRAVLHSRILAAKADLHRSQGRMYNAFLALGRLLSRKST